MVDTLVESSSNVEMILKFFDMFLKLKDLTTSDNFKKYDPECKGIISKKEFQKSMESQKQYSQSEIEFLLSCAEADENDMCNYKEFVERFHEPAKDIGFNVAVLLTNLSEHMPHNSRLATFLDLAESVLSYFEPYLGLIEILGSAKRIERVYFEISELSREQWEKPQVKESKRQFIFDVVNEGEESEKMEMFVNFCEDTIFEMQLASQISEPDVVETPEEEEEEEAHSILEELSGGEEDALESALAFTTACRSVNKNISDIWQIFAVKNIRKQFKKVKKLTLSIRELITGFFSFFWMLFIGFFKGIFSLLFGFFHLFWSSMFGGGLVEGAKNMKVTDILGNMPDPTQFGIHGDVGGEDKLEAIESSGSLDKTTTPPGDGTEMDVMLEINWCKVNNLSLNVDKTKEMVVDFRRIRSDHSPLSINGSSVEIVNNIKFLGVHLDKDLTWSLNTSFLYKKSQQRLFFLRRLRKAQLPPTMLTTFYRGTIESILSCCITAWFGNCAISDRKTLQRIVKTAEKIIGVSLPSIKDIYTTRCIRKATSIVADWSHPSHTLFTLLPSGRRYRSIRALTSRLCNSFFPQAIRLLNEKGLD
ncbi:ryanodine receptor 3 [Nothobranchius furzeri]|uniref:ryanodine receptor 3 n=1 Tax=Nothobranchius furzeri TaxID=105023 RepID=UPI0039046E05